MCAEIFERVRPARDTLHECSRLLQDLPDFVAPDDWHAVAGVGHPFTLLHLLYAPSVRDAAGGWLQQSRYAQPALFAVEVSLARALAAVGIHPDVVLGHSLGEYAALVSGGVLPLPDALAFVVQRGRLMDACPAGAMAALPMPEAEVLQWLQDHPGCGLHVCAVNSDAQTVVGGAIADVDAAAAMLPPDVVPRRLRTSHAFHTPCMEPAAADLQRHYERLCRAAQSARPTRPTPLRMLSNVVGGWLEGDPLTADALPAAYAVDHMLSPVRFHAQTQALAAHLGDAPWVGIEVGPGAVLTALLRRADLSLRPIEELL